MQQVRRGRTEPLDFLFIQSMDGRDHLRFRIAASASMQEAPKRNLVFAAFIDIRNPELWLPEKGVVSALKDLALFGD